MSSLVTASCFIVPLSLSMIWSASTITTDDAEVSPSRMFNSVPVVVTAVEPFNLGCVSVLFVSVCVPVSVATVLSIERVMLLPLRAESTPVPPSIPSVSESKSIELSIT